MSITELPPRLHVKTGELFIAFMKVGISGFGGVLPFARRMLVEQRQWLTELEFNEVMTLSQFLPGPNIVNVSIIVGRRFQGVAGVFAATLGLMTLPLMIILMLATIYGRYVHIDAVRGASSSVSAAAAGLMLAVGFKMARPLRGTPWQIAIGIVVFAAVALLRWPLLGVLAVVGPAAVATAWWLRK